MRDLVTNNWMARKLDGVAPSMGFDLAIFKGPQERC